MIRVNGRATEFVPATDRGLAYGDGVFRTLAVRAGRPRHWARHYAKLAFDCARLRLPCPDAGVLLADLEAVAQSGDCAVKIIVTRGCSERGYRSPVPARPNRVVIGSALPRYPAACFERGVRLYECVTRIAAQPALAGVKHLNRLENVLARAEWSDDAYAEGLMQDDNEHVVCGTMTNVFIVEGGTLCTPELARGGVAGVTRERVLEGAARSGVPVVVAPLSFARVAAADEVFVVNSLIGVWRARAIGSAPIPTGPMAARAKAWLDEDDADD